MAKRDDILKRALDDLRVSRQLNDALRTRVRVAESELEDMRGVRDGLLQARDQLRGQLDAQIHLTMSATQKLEAALYAMQLMQNVVKRLQLQSRMAVRVQEEQQTRAGFVCRDGKWNPAGDDLALAVSPDTNTKKRS